MTSRERLLAVLSGKQPDRVPISPFIQEEYLSYYFSKNNTSRLYDAIKLANELDFDLMTRQTDVILPPFMLNENSNWKIIKNTKIENSNYYKITKFETPEGSLSMTEAAPYKPEMQSGIHLQTVKYLIEDEDDFDIFEKYAPKASESDLERYKKAGIEAKNAIGSRGITCPWGNGSVFNLATTFIEMQDMLCDAITDKNYYKRYMTYFTDIVEANSIQMAQTEFDAVGFQGNMANSALLSEDFFRKNVMPYEQRAIAPLSEVGKPTIYHNCGYAKGFYSAYKDMNMTVWETISPFPQGDNTLIDAKNFFGTSKVLAGNFDQIDFLKKASPKEVEQAAYEQMIVGKENGHYIFACSDYIETGTPLENIKALIKGALRGSNY